jgi:predicted nucleic acid-binding protein
MIVLDTNVISELMKVEADPAVQAWMKTQPVSALKITSISVEEIRFGLTIMPIGKRRQGLEDAFLFLFNKLEIFDFDMQAAEESALYRARRARIGRPMSIPDANIAGIALSRKVAVATRDTLAFDDAGIEVINPWDFK